MKGTIVQDHVFRKQTKEEVENTVCDILWQLSVTFDLCYMILNVNCILIGLYAKSLHSNPIKNAVTGRYIVTWRTSGIKIWPFLLKTKKGVEFTIKTWTVCLFWVHDRNGVFYRYLGDYWRMWINRFLKEMTEKYHVVYSGWMIKSPPEKKLTGPWKIFRAVRHIYAWSSRYILCIHSVSIYAMSL